jgi:hypothetical protein
MASWTPRSPASCSGPRNDGDRLKEGMRSHFPLLCLSSFLGVPVAAAVTAGLRALSSKAFREGIGDLLKQADSWTFLGCDEVGARKLDRLGARVTRICYARATGKESNQLVEVLYTSDWRGGGGLVCVLMQLSP